MAGLVAAGEGADAGDELGKGERLGQVVVGAEAEAVDAVFDRVGGGEHEHARARPARNERPADVVAVDLGQVAVEQDHVVAVSRCVPERVFAVEDDVDGHAFAPQPDRDGGGELLVVFDDEHPHPRFSLPLPASRMPQRRLHTGNSFCSPAVTGSGYPSGSRSSRSRRS